MTPNVLSLMMNSRIVSLILFSLDLDVLVETSFMYLRMVCDVRPSGTSILVRLKPPGRELEPFELSDLILARS